jgi:hypothetical protein
LLPWSNTCFSIDGSSSAHHLGPRQLKSRAACVSISVGLALCEAHGPILDGKTFETAGVAVIHRCAPVGDDDDSFRVE